MRKLRFLPLLIFSVTFVIGMSSCGLFEPYDPGKGGDNGGGGRDTTLNGGGNGGGRDTTFHGGGGNGGRDTTLHGGGNGGRDTTLHGGGNGGRDTTFHGGGGNGGRDTTNHGGGNGGVTRDSLVSGRGIVVFNSFEGGFFGILSSNGAQYDPINLPREFAVDGLKVNFTLRLHRNMGSMHLWGTSAEVISMTKVR